MLCHSVFSVRSPEFLSIHPSSVAIENRQKGVPLAVYFSSGSRPSRPTRITLFTDFAIVQFSKGLSAPAAGRCRSRRFPFREFLLGKGRFGGAGELHHDSIHCCDCFVGLS